MKATELRIGNWIFCESLNKTIQVTPTEIECAVVMEGHFKLSFKPIELTEELLLKCGFEEYMSKTDLRISIGGGVLLQFYFGINQIECWIGDEISTNRIEYLHQLQNLYFALTQTELQITL